MRRRDVLAAGLCWCAAPTLGDERAALNSVNQLRRLRGRRALRWSSPLVLAAQAHADDMARGGFFAHQGANGSDVGARVTAAGYRWCGVAENIAKGQTTLDKALKGWRTSRGHRRNMMDREMTDLGVARGAGNIWVMVLARGC
ncbi:CAP domain-containing protein [Phaeobacter sp. J2-8]|uniref:CAP domain-containing protein n=1 Tax=Phaeobacter sp. J2-8 TaxID=2931394 RepID=UPI001FD2CA59|nr:CAP domain-containing protein [Phaeobacter sp. J2-8]MCJ7871878.1 CAP domain-containing protein [Phaeobacter sp. J2-8]